ncbi:unnamed protein product, partial [Ectocarpus fasciculatus]
LFRFRAVSCGVGGGKKKGVKRGRRCYQWGLLEVCSCSGLSRPLQWHEQVTSSGGCTLSIIRCTRRCSLAMHQHVPRHKPRPSTACLSLCLVVGRIVTVKIK